MGYKKQVEELKEIIRIKHEINLAFLQAIKLLLDRRK